MNKKLLIFFFIYIVLEGALRKWFLPEYNNLLFLLKDLLLLLVFASLLFKKKELTVASSFLNQQNKLIWWSFALFIIFFGLLRNFDNLTIIGWRYYLASIPLIVLIPAYFYKDFNKYAYVYLILAIPILLLGFYQFYNPQNIEINKYAWSASEMNIAVFGDNRPRITSTFSYITPYTVYLQTIILLSWIFILQSNTKLTLYISTAILFLSIINLVMSGSRGPLLLSAILSIPFLYYYLRRFRNKFKVFVITLVFVLLSINLLVDPFKSFVDRTSSAGDTDSRIYGALLTPYITFSSMDIIGAGLGSTFLGTRELYNKDFRTFFDEVNQDRVGIELGIFGYLFVLFIKIYFVSKTFILIKSTSKYQIKYWLWFSLGIQLSSVWSIPIYNSIAATFYFSSIGIYYLMCRKHQNILKQKASIVN